MPLRKVLDRLRQDRRKRVRRTRSQISPDERRAAQSCPFMPKPDAPRYPGYTRMSPWGRARGATLLAHAWPRDRFQALIYSRSR